MSGTCRKCTLNVNDKSPGIQCGFCTKFFHAKCLALSKEQVALFNDIQGTLYKCEECRIKPKPNKEVVKECVNCHELLLAIKDLQSVVNNLQAELINLKENKMSDNTELIISEISERQRREKNIIIYKLEEQVNGTTANKIAADTQKAVDIIKSIAPAVVTTNIKTYRLKKNDGNNISPLKVELISRDDVFTILKNKKKLKDYNMNIQISTDKTLLQRQYLKSVISQLNQRKENGEEDLYIKYLNGKPVIAQSKK